EARDETQQGGLAAAARAEQDHELLVVDRQGDVGQRRRPPVALGDPLDLDLSHHLLPTPNALNRYGRMKKMNTKAGIVRHRPPANRNASGDSESCCTTAAGRVGLRSVRMTATNTSFHDVTNANKAAAARPGTLLGSTTRSTAPTRLVPSDIAASSSSAGTRRKTLAVIRMVSGSVIAVWTSATDRTVS